MPDRIYVNEARGIIEVESFGEVTKADIAQSIANARQILVEKNINKIFVDTRKQETMPSTMSIFDLFSTLPTEFMIALLLVKSQATEGDLSFAEAVGMNRGVNVKIFYEEDEALHWLNPSQ